MCKHDFRRNGFDVIACHADGSIYQNVENVETESLTLVP